MQNMHHSKQSHDILISDRSSEDKQLLIGPFLRETKKYEHGGLLKFKINILFYGETHEPLHVS
jgi:hypothetical protein